MVIDASRQLTTVVLQTKGNQLERICCHASNVLCFDQTRAFEWLFIEHLL